jgi:hypothetical protein
MTRGWRKSHEENLDNVSFLPDIVVMIKSKKMRWAGHVAFLGD